ncbi:spore germination protein GerW family protein [Streptomyces sp. NPDC051940]|uniref:spore germination protein GerW family protein n=1 Tax=Streptomyces sp. NPDC051940 TaxID=3155675 RepID=UPI003432973D
MTPSPVPAVPDDTPPDEAAPAPDTTRSPEAPQAPAAHAAAALLDRLAQRLGGHASVTAVYGEPVTHGDVTVIPVARIGFGFGGGTGRETGSAKTGDGGGGGGGAMARPLGFVEIAGGRAVYRPVRDPWTSAVLPLAGLLLGVALARALARRRR